MANEDDDVGSPLPDFRTQGLQLQTLAPALGVAGNSPDYLDYDPKGRSIFGTMCANSGVAYLIGIGGGGLYGFRQGLAATPSSRFRVQVNSVLNHCGRYGSRAGNAFGVFAVLYSLFEGGCDYWEPDVALGLNRVSPFASSFLAPSCGASLAAATYYSTSGPRVAALAGCLGFGSVAATYAAYTALGIPYGSGGFLFL